MKDLLREIRLLINSINRLVQNIKKDNVLTILITLKDAGIFMELIIKVFVNCH